MWGRLYIPLVQTQPEHINVKLWKLPCSYEIFTDAVDSHTGIVSVFSSTFDQVFYLYIIIFCWLIKFKNNYLWNVKPQNHRQRQKIFFIFCIFLQVKFLLQTKTYKNKHNLYCYISVFTNKVSHIMYFLWHLLEMKGDIKDNTQWGACLIWMDKTVVITSAESIIKHTTHSRLPAYTRAPCQPSNAYLL